MKSESCKRSSLWCSSSKKSNFTLLKYNHNCSLIKGVKIKLYNSLSTNSIWYHVQDLVKEKLLRLHYLKCFVITDSWLVNINIWASLVAQTLKNLPAVQETWVQSLGLEDPLEKGKATHSSVLAGRIPWIEEPGRLQSLVSKRVRHDWTTEHTHIHEILILITILYLSCHVCVFCVSILYSVCII